MARLSPSSSQGDRQQTDRFDLSALFEFSNIVNASLDLNFILGHFLLTIMGKILSTRGIILLKKEEEKFAVKTTKGIHTELLNTEIVCKKIPQRIVYVQREDARKYPWLKLFREQGISVLIPLLVRERIFGIAGFSPLQKIKKLGQKEETYIKSLANIAATAIEKSLIIEEVKQVNRRLDGKVQELNTLFEMSKEFNAALDAERLLKLLSFSLLGQVGTSRYFVCLKKERAMQVVLSRLQKELSPLCLEAISTIQQPTLIESLTKKPYKVFCSMLKDAGVQVLVPLKIQNEVKGILGVGERMRGGEYTQTDLEFLSSLGNLAMISLENARLFRDAIEKQKMEDELLIAREIQKGLLPSVLPAIPHYDIAATNISSKQVGGDYYDVIRLSETKVLVAIGDVSGKGTPASLLMANLQAAIHALVPLGLTLPELSARVNDLIFENTTSDKFITFFLAIIDSETKSLMYVNAGHNPPYILHKDGTLERLDKGGIIFGVMKTMMPYEQGTAQLNEGEALILFTDGVSEAMSKEGEELGEPKLEEVIKANATEPAEKILNEIVAAVQQHSTGTTQYDDITMVVVRGI
ncbi:MAG: PP2C family protein-serine/threonine phosphatase [Ignavibacteriae bacterium]|nr:PP2C family protein-serine/threonine phosphatase [Ignavibacteriota bacterium]